MEINYLNKNIGIIGGDLRISKLVMLLVEDNYQVHTYALEEAECVNVKQHDTIETFVESVDIVISGVPLSRDEKTVFAPLSKKIIAIDELLRKLKNKTFIAGAIKENVYDIAKGNNIEIIDMLEKEELTILNCIPTAEGALQVAMEESEITLHRSNVLVLGYGRIGKILSKMLWRNRSKCVLCC